MKVRRLIVLLFATAIAGCATNYDPESAEGFHETQLSANPPVFEIFFRGNRYSKTGRMRDYATLRAAELALQHGYSHFQLIGSRSWTKGLGSTPDAAAPHADATRWPPDDDAVWLHVSRRSPLYQLTAVLVQLDDIPEASYPKPLDAREVFEELTKKYGIDRQLPTKSDR